MDYRPVPFVNTGAVCYVNSTWQAILSLKAVQDKLHDQILLYRMQGEAPADLADSNLLKVALLLQRLVRTPSVTSPVLLTQFIEAAYRKFQDRGQQDAEEYFSLLMDIPLYRPLQRLFEGKWAVTIHCRTCGYVSTQNEPFVVLSVGLVQEHGSVGGSVSSVSTTNTTYASVQQCIDAYLDEHMVPEHVCDKCHIRGTTTHRQRMQSVPSALAVQLKRFQATRGKLAAPVYVDRTIRVHDHEFVLRGVVVHHGPSRDHGHYTAFCRVGADPSPDDSSGSSGSSSGAWVHANDSSIAPANDDALNRACAYLCFYDRVERIDVGA